MKKLIFFLLVCLYASVGAQAQTELDKLKPYFVSKADLSNGEWFLPKVFVNSSVRGDAQDYWMLLQNDTLYFNDMKHHKVEHSYSSARPLTKKLAHDLYQTAEGYFLAFHKYTIFMFSASLTPANEYHPSGITSMYGATAYFGGATKISLFGEYKGFPPESLGAEWLKMPSSGVGDMINKNMQVILAKHKTVLTNALNKKGNAEADVAKKKADAFSVEWKAELAKNPDAALSMEENFAKWSAKGKPKLVYYTGAGGTMEKLHKLSTLPGYRLIKTEMNGSSEVKIIEFKGEVPDIQVAMFKNKKYGDCNYYKLGTDWNNTVFGESFHGALYGYTKSYFYGYMHATHDIMGVKPPKKVSPSVYSDMGGVFWYNGNLVNYFPDKRSAYGHITVIAFPGAGDISFITNSGYSIWNNYVVKYLFELQKKAIK